MLFLFILFFTLSPCAQADPKPIRDDSPSDEETKSPRSGEQAYREVCSICHGAEGKGIEKMFPPLVPSEWVQDEIILTNIILRGLAGEIFVSGTRYASAMPPMHTKLTDTEVVAIVDFLLKKNDQKSTLQESDVQRIRQFQLPNGIISSQAGLESIRTNQSKEPRKKHSPWKGCSSQ